MERAIENERYPDDRKPLGTSGRISLSHSSQSVKPQGKLKQERHSFTYGEICHETHEIAIDANDSPCKASRSHQSIYGKTTKNDEIVKYMSNLPSYLERGEHLQEKVLSVGVLDWGRLEKWQCGHKELSRKSSWNPPIRSDASLSSSTDRLSPNFCKHHLSPSCQRSHRPSLYSHLTASPHSEFVKSFGESDEKCQDHDFFGNNTVNGKGKVIQREQHLCKGNQEVKIKQSGRKNPETKILRECKTLPGGLKYEGLPAKYGEITGAGKSQVQDSVANNHYILKTSETVVFLPGDLRKNNDTEVSKLSDSTSLLGQKLEDARQRSLMERSMASFSAQLKPDISNSSETFCEVNKKQCLLMKNCSVNVPDTSCSAPSSVSAGFNPPTNRRFEPQTPVVAPLNSMVNEASSGLDLKASTGTVAKVRSSSPFSQLSVSMGWRHKSSSSNQGSTHMSVKAGAENATPSACLNDSINEKPSSTGRVSSSPLRRLLDPLLKPKVAIYCHAIEPSEKDMVGEACNQPSYTSTRQARKLKLDVSRCRKVTVNDSALDKKHGPSVVRGLLQVAFKNGLPLFTFAVDNVSNILAATMKLTSSGKEKSSHIYTFFRVQEVKKKNGSWMNHGNKGKGRDYVSNVIAQMKVSESQISHLTKSDESSMREFILISVDLGQGDASDFQPNEELAAVVVKFPPKIKQRIVRDEFQRNAFNNLPEDGSRECLSGVKSYPCSNESVLVQQPVGSEAFINTTVLLPSGVHSLPSKGGPSSLIERWRSGGSCDCGGWDLGCKLRVLANQNQDIEKSSSEPSQFKLFPQEGMPEDHCVLSLATFKDTIYSVEFNSAISLLQAFSICLAIIDSKNSYELSESSILFEAKTSGETKFVQNDRLRTPKLAVGEAPAEHVTCPPLSPFGRV